MSQNDFATADEIYRAILDSQRVVFEARLVQPGDIYFGIQKHEPVRPRQRLVWELYRFLERNARFLISGITLLLRPTRYGEKARRLATREFDGNAYAGTALKQGASFVVVDNRRFGKHPRSLLVENVHQCLVDAAQEHRRRLPVPLIGITGSTGKSTTTALVQAMLAERYQVIATDQANSIRDLAAKVFEIDAQTSMAVFELSTIKRHMLAAICDLVQPTHGLITNIGRAHTGFFGGVENIQLAKWELYDHLQQTGGTGWLNLNDGWLQTQRTRLTGAITFGSVQEADVVGEAIPTEDPLLNIRWRFGTGSIWETPTQLLGVHYLDSALAAIAIGVHFDIPEDRIHQVLSDFEPLARRMQLVQHGSTRYLIDNFNVSPESLLAALETLETFPSLKRVAVVGYVDDMMGYADAVHQEMVQVAQAKHFDHLIFVGQGYGPLVQTGERVHVLSGPGQVRQWLQQQDLSDTCILIKGGGTRGLERITP